MMNHQTRPRADHTGAATMPVTLWDRLAQASEEAQGAVALTVTKAGSNPGALVPPVSARIEETKPIELSFSKRCRASGLTIQVGRSVAHGKNIPYLPMLEAFRSYLGITDTES